MTLYAAMRDRLLAYDDAAGETAAHLVGRSLECVAATDEYALVGTFGDGLWRSAGDESGSGDGGATESFERVGADVLEPKVMSLAVAPDDPDVVWAGTEPSRVYRSTDGGRTWTEKPGVADLPSAEGWYFPPRPHTHHVRWLEPHPADPETLYVGIEAGALVRTFDGGETWVDRPEGARRDNHTLTSHPDAPDRLWTAAGDGYAESEDRGDTWRYPQEGLDHRYCWSVALDPADPETAVLSAASGPGNAHSQPGESYVYRRSGDGPWVRVGDGAGGDGTNGDAGLPAGEGVLRAVLETGDDGAFYACNNRGIYRSADAGATWERLGVEWDDELEARTCRGLAVV